MCTRTRRGDARTRTRGHRVKHGLRMRGCSLARVMAPFTDLSTSTDVGWRLISVCGGGRRRELEERAGMLTCMLTHHPP